MSTLKHIDQVLRFCHKVLGLRIGLLHDQSTGRLAANTEFYFRNTDEKVRKKDLFFSSESPSNRFLLTLIKRNVKVISHDLILKFLKDVKAAFPRSPYWIDLDSSGYYHWEKWFEKKPQLSLREEELKQGRAFLRHWDTSPEVKFVCIHGRSPFYKDNVNNSIDSWWLKHDFRTCDIENYREAAEYLAGKGFLVFRMGRPENDPPIQWNNPRIIDFANKHYDPFLEIFLLSQCSFFLGNTSGIYLYASIFDRPVAYANMVPVGECGRKNSDLFILKKYFNRKTKSYIPFSEIIRQGGDLDKFTKAQLQHFEEQGLVIEENSGQDILEMTKEMLARLEGRYQEPSRYVELTEKFKKLFPEKHVMRDFPSPICSAFILKNEEIVR